MKELQPFPNDFTFADVSLYHIRAMPLAQNV
jgi:hypothetical protein